MARTRSNMRPRAGFHRLSGRIAAFTGAGTAGAGLIWFLIVGGTVLRLVGLVVFAVLCSYGAAHLLLASRMIGARRILRQIRRHELSLADRLPSPRGDEMDVLRWQIQRTGIQLHKENGELRKMENYRREFLGNVSHELKTPLFAIQGFAETLLDGALDNPEVNRRFIEKILSNAVRLNHLVRDLTEISRLESGTMTLNVETFRFAVLVTEVIESLDGPAQAAGISLSSDVHDDGVLVAGDRERIRQVLINLIENGIKYNDAGGHVAVGAQLVPSGDLIISVRDDGIGIAPRDVKRITERFYRVDQSRSRDQGGTGLGLAIVKHILAVHEQRLTIESTPGKGSTFSFSLPVATGASAVIGSAPRSITEINLTGGIRGN